MNLPIAGILDEVFVATASLTRTKCESRSVVSDSLRSHGLYSPWNSPGQNTGVDNLSLLQGIDPGIDLGSPALQVDSLPTELSGKPYYHSPVTTPNLQVRNFELVDLFF